MIEPTDVARMENLVDMMLRRAADDPAAFAQVDSVLQRFRNGMPAATVKLQEQGFSWGDIASELGVTKQAAHRKYHPSRS